MAGEKTVFVRVGADVEGAITGLRKVKSSVDDLAKTTVAKPAKGLESVAQSAAKVSPAVNKASSSVKGLETAAAAAGKTAPGVDKVAGALGRTGKAAQGAADPIKKTTASLAEMAKAEREAARETDKAAKVAQKAARETARVEAKAQAERKEALGSFANKAALGSAVLAAGVGVAIARFADFDAQMSAVGAATDATAGEMDLLRDAAMKAGADTKYSASEAAAGITELGKAGISTNDILGGGLNGALALAAAGQIEVADAAETTASALTQFKLKGDQASHVADLLAAGANAAQGGVGDLSAALGQTGLIAAQTGLSIEETAGGLTAFANAGLIGSDAGTSFKTMLMRLIPQSDDAAHAMEDIGLKAYDTQGNFIGLEGVAGQLQAGLSKLSQEQRAQAINTIFGADAARAAGILYSQGAAGVAEWTKKVDHQGAAAETAAKLMDNLKGDVEQFTGSLETAFIKGGSAANSGLRTLTQAATGAVNIIGQLPAPILLGGAALGAVALGIPKAVLGWKAYQAQLVATGLSMDALAARSARLATSLTVFKGAAIGLAAVAGIGMVTNALTDISEIEFDPQSIKDGTVTLADFNKKLAETDDLGLPVVSTLSDFGAVLANTFNPGAYEQVDSFFASLNAGLGFENTSDVEVARKRFEDLDKTLTALVAAGKGEAAAALFKQITDAAAAQGIKIDDVKSKLPGYADAMANVGDEAAAAGPKIGEMSQDVKDIEKKADDAKKALDDLRSAIEGFGSPLAKQRAAQRDYADTIDAARASVKGYTDDLVKQRLESEKIDPEKASKKQKAAAKDWADAQIAAGKALDISTDAGRKNQAALDSIRDATLKASTATFDLTSNASLAAAEVAKGREAFIKQAESMGLSKTAASGLADQMGLIPRSVETQIGLSGVDTANTQLDKVTGKVTVLDKKTAKPKLTPVLNGVQIDIANARLDKIDRRNVKPTVSPHLNGAAADAAEARLALLARNRTATITVTALTGAANTRIANTRAAIQDIRGYSTGGPIYGPGTTTSDSIPALLSDKEYVIKAAAVQKYGVHLFDNLNAMRLASGGSVGRPALTNYRSAPAGASASMSIDYDRLGAAVAAHAVPQIGTVYGGPDTMTAVRRALHERDWELGNR